MNYKKIKRCPIFSNSATKYVLRRTEKTRKQKKLCVCAFFLLPATGNYQQAINQHFYYCCDSAYNWW